MIFQVRRRWIYQLRVINGLTQTEMAEILGLSRTGYNKIELGIRGLKGRKSRTNHFKTLANHFGGDEDFYRKEEEMFLHSVSITDRDLF